MTLRRDLLTCVYFAQLVGHDIIKIGCTYQPGARMAGIRYMARRDFGFDDCAVEYLALTKGDELVEREYHERFTSHRITGEWFRAHAEILTCAKSLSSMNVRDFYGQKKIARGQ